MKALIIGSFVLLFLSSCSLFTTKASDEVRQVTLNCHADGNKPWLTVTGTEESFKHHGDHIEILDQNSRKMMDVSGQCSLRYWHLDELIAIQREQEKAAAQAKAESAKPKKKAKN